MRSSEQKEYWNPYVAGVGIGMTLLASFVIIGKGLGASGGMTAVVSFLVDMVAPNHAQANSMYSTYLQNKLGHPLADWFVFELLGVTVGGFLSGYFSGRSHFTVEKGSRIGSWQRLALAFLGGTMMGVAAKISRGCTSGQALTGGALLNLGSWMFMLAMFAGAFGIAYFVRKQWV